MENEIKKEKRRNYKRRKKEKRREGKGEKGRSKVLKILQWGRIQWIGMNMSQISF